jgi:ABC-type transporter MlaC component
MTGRGLLGGGVAALLLLAPAAATLAQTVSPAPDKTATKPAKTASTPAKKSVPAKITAKKAEPSHPAKKLAAAAQKSEPKKVATTAKKPEPKKIAAAPKKPEAKKIAAARSRPEKIVEPARAVAAATSSSLPSYTVTTTRDHVTYTSTRIVPLPATPPSAARPAAVPVTAAAVASVTPPAVKPTVVPVSLTNAAVASLPQPPAKPAAPPLAAPPAPASAKLAAPTPAAPPLAATAAPPADATGAAGFVEHFLQEAFQLAKPTGNTSLQRRARLADLFSRKMDISRIAGYTTADELTEMTPDIQQRFRTILISYLVETYYPRLELASDPSVKVETVPAPALPDGTAVVTTIFSKEGWGSQSVKWELAAEPGGYRIVDIFSAGASLVQMERDTFVSVMRNGGLTELMAKLDARTKQLATAATE